jgi:hypothetical protein
MPHEQIPTWARDGRKAGSLSRLAGSKYPIVDAHLHVVNFIQETPGGEALVEAMDRAHVPEAVVFGLPVSKVWTEYDVEPPDYYLANDSPCYYYGCTDVLVAEMVRALPAGSQARLYPLICGFNPVDRYAVRHVERLYRQYPDVWSGIGELLLRHDDLTAFTYGENARANHRALWPVYEFAAHYDLPVLVHQNVTSVTKSDHPVYLHELEEALREFPRTRFVFAHCGMSRRVDVPFYHQMVDRRALQRPDLPRLRPGDALRAARARAAALRRVPRRAGREGAGRRVHRHRASPLRRQQGQGAAGPRARGARVVGGCPLTHSPFVLPSAGTVRLALAG